MRTSATFNSSVAFQPKTYMNQPECNNLKGTVALNPLNGWNGKIQITLKNICGHIDNGKSTWNFHFQCDREME